MRLMTFQDRTILSIINYNKESGNYAMYAPDKDYNDTNEKEIQLMKMLTEKIKSYMHIDQRRHLIPVWCWVMRRQDDIDDMDYINDMFIRHIPRAKKLMALELEVPKENVFLMNYLIWEQIYCDVKFDRDINKELFNKLFEKKKGATLQACIPFILEDYIVKKKIIRRDISENRLYPMTDSEIRNLINNGEISLNSFGDIESFDNEEE